MNVSDKLQLIRALEERERVVARRGGRVAWTSVVLAALVLMLMIGVARVELAKVNARVTAAQKSLGDRQKELAATEARLATVRAETDQALRKLQSVAACRENPLVVESAVDNLLAASAAAAPTPDAAAPSGSDARRGAIRQLFDPAAAIRVRAYSALLPRYANDPTLVPEILAVAREDPSNANGIYNALVVLSHMNAASLRPYRAEIIAFAEQAKRIGPRVADRAGTLIGRVPS